MDISDLADWPLAEAEAATVDGGNAVSGQRKDLLRFLTCGSVDDGKSTLIGRLLYETGNVGEDELAILRRDSRRYGTTGNELDLALLVDGLEAEREQKITIDVGYRYFSTRRRKFIVGDAPGHEQYTRNMATAASIADLAVLLVDARKGILPQTCRHAYIASLFGVRSIVLAVNKMDLVGYDEERFAEIVAAFGSFATRCGLNDISAVPISAVKGDNITRPSTATPWYGGPTFLELLETASGRVGDDGSFRMPVQQVLRPDQDFHGFAGTVSRGEIRAGDRICVLPSGKTSTVARIVTRNGDLDRAATGRAIALTLETEIDISRGDVIVAASDRPEQADQFAAHIVWMTEEPLYPGRPYHIKIGTRTIVGQVSEIKHRVDVNTLDHHAARSLALNEIGFCNLSVDRAIPYEPYRANPALGGFILIDRMTNATVGCGMIDFALRRSSNLAWQPVEVDQKARTAIKGHKPVVLWFTGLSGAGKSTIANEVEARLHARGCHTYLLDGDNLRHGLNKDLGFKPEDRVENIRRVGEVAKLFVDAGTIVLVSLISPFRNERRMVREMLAAGEFIEVFVDTPLAECERRDPKGLYRRARSGAIVNFTGIDSPYEPPEHAEIVLKTLDMPVLRLAELVLDALKSRGVLP